MPKKNATCDRCGGRAAIGWDCPDCHRYLCNVCCGRTTERPRDMGGFSMESFSMGGEKCPYCSGKKPTTGEGPVSKPKQGKWWEFWK